MILIYGKVLIFLSYKEKTALFYDGFTHEVEKMIKSVARMKARNRDTYI